MTRTDRLSPDQARAEVERHGGIVAAARALGVPRPTFTRWLREAPREPAKSRPAKSNGKPSETRHGATAEKVRQRLAARGIYAPRPDDLNHGWRP